MIFTLNEPSAKTSSSESSTLVTKETTVQFDSIPTYGATLRRSCSAEYLAAEAGYEALDHLRPRKRADILRSCRTQAYFVRHDVTGEVQVASSSCKLRWCPLCARARKVFIQHQVAEWLGDADHPKFITLTLKHTNAPLEHQVKHLYNYFRELRRRKDFRDKVTGGIWFFHIKKSKTDSKWHPHLHCLITGLYIPRSRLSHLWSEVTYGSYHVHIRAVNDNERASAEAARYSACPGSLAGMSSSDMVELIEAMHGKRICGTWGTGRAMSLRPEPMYERHHWTNIGNWQVVNGSRDTDKNADAILSAWHNKHPLPSGITCIHEISQRTLDELLNLDESDFSDFPAYERDPP